MRNAPLEWVRGLAAVYVFLGHYNHLNDEQPLPWKWVQILHFGTEAVIVFFLLSGTVIRLSTERRRESRYEFLRRRAARILPLYWFAVAFTLAVQLCVTGHTDSWKQITGNLLMLQTQEALLVGPVRFNDPLWSLSFETVFYVIFACTIGRFQGVLLKAWAAAAVAGVVLQVVWNPEGVPGHLVIMFAYSAIWLLGYYLPDVAKVLNVDAAAAITCLGFVPMASRLVPTEAFHYHCAAVHLLVAVFVAPLIVYGLRAGGGYPIAQTTLRPWHTVLPYLILAPVCWFGPAQPTSRIVYVIAPGVAGAIGTAIGATALDPSKLLPRTGLTLGRVSYALYVIHCPVIYLSQAVSADVPTRVVFVLATVPALVVVMEYIFQPWTVRWLFADRGARPPRPPTAPRKAA
jgi:peptidoglycan/LPS O-acetylase OafA/YrhL